LTKTDLSRFQNEDYKPGSVLKRMSWYLVNRLFLNTSILYPAVFKVFILRFFGAKIGTGIVLKPNISIKYPWFLEIGNHVWIGERVWIDNLSHVSIADHCCLSQGALLLTGNHDYKKTSFDLTTREIHLEEGVWIGAKCVVGPGVRCRSHSVLSVGSFTSKDLDAYGIYQGNPAIKIRNRQIR
jgi:putative colanic acid biosynthesis acetyltransferase WcaF